MSAVTIAPGRIVTGKRNVTRNVTKKPKPSSFHRLRLKCCLSVDACADLCGVSARSVWRWDTDGAPLIVHRLLEMYDRQDLSGHEGWRGWRFSRGKLVCGRLSFHPRNLRQVPHLVDVFNRVESARVRYVHDGLPVDQCLSIVFSSPAFLEIPLLAEDAQAGKPGGTA